MTGDGAGQLLFRFVRHWSRRSLAPDAGGERGRLVLVCEAVHALAQRGVPATVNAIAREIGVDQSGASRMLGSASAAGHVDIAASTADARRREASLTAVGRSMLDQAHRWQEDVFAELTAGWDDARREALREAMSDLMERSSAVDV